jgi:hypothetical protein
MAKQVRPQKIGADFNKQAPKQTFKNPMQTVFKGSAKFTAAGKGFRTRGLDGARAKFRGAR